VFDFHNHWFQFKKYFKIKELPILTLPRAKEFSILVLSKNLKERFS
jgi:hypothetical protein